MPRFQHFGLGLLVASLAFNAGCGGCSKKKKKKKNKATSAQTEKKAPEARPRVEIVPTPAAAAIQVAGRSYLWTDGRTATLSLDTPKVSWSDDGFEYADLGGTRVMAPGGTIYWRFTPAKVAPKPLAELLTQPSTPPAGFELKVEPGKANKTQVTITGPEGRHVRVGLFNEAPNASVWLQGKLPEGTRPAKALDNTAGWKLDADGQTPKQELPDGATAITPTAPAAELLKGWAADIGKLRGGEVTVLTSGSFDTDGDPYVEGFLCVSGGKGDYPCFVVDEVGGERRYYGVNIPFDDPAKGVAPAPFTKDGNTYVLWVGRPARSNEATPKVLQVLRYSGTGYTVDTIR